MSLKVKVGGLYKCNAGGVWKAVANIDQLSYRKNFYKCTRIGKYMNDIIYRRGQGRSSEIDLEQQAYKEFNFDEDGIMDTNLRFISEIEP